MIRVNLLRNLGAATVDGGAAFGGAADVVSVDLQKQAAIKIAVILLLPGLVWAYKGYMEDQLKSRQQTLTQDIQNVETETASFGSAGPRVKRAMDLKNKIAKEIKVITELARFRLREVKALDQIQDVFRMNGVWLKELKGEKGKIEIKGYALGETTVNELLERLRSNIFFSELETKGTSQEQHPTLGKMIQYELVFQIGRPGEG